MWLLKGPVAGLAKPCQAILAMASRSMANITAWRNLTLFIGALRLFSHSHEWGEKNSQPLVVSVTPGSLDRRTTSKNRSEEYTSELQSRFDLVCRLLLEKKKKMQYLLLRKQTTNTTMEATEKRDDV